MTEMQFLLAVVGEMQLRGWKADLETSAMGRPFARAVRERYTLLAAVEPVGGVPRPSVTLVERGVAGNVTDTLTRLDGLTPQAIEMFVDGVLAETRRR